MFKNSFVRFHSTQYTVYELMTNSLTEIYSEHHKKNRGRNFVFYEKERSEFIQHHTRNMGKRSILDIGCRDGALTRYAISKENTITGCDIDTDSLHHAKERGINTVYMDLNGQWEEIRDKRYDIVMAFEIIEHLYFPEKVLEKIKAHLKEDAYLIGSVPNAFSWMNRILLFLGTKKGTPLSDPTHINHFSYSELKATLKKHFTKVEILPLVTQNRKILAKISPGLFGAGFLFKCSNKPYSTKKEQL